MADTTQITFHAAAVGGYLLGSVPFGLVLTWVAGYGDLRQMGSGNIGATNVLRCANKPLALLTLILDSGKGAVAVLVAQAVAGPVGGLVAGLGAVLGHNFPVWLHFRGGKGVATTLGTLIAIAWPVGLGACALWLLVALLFRYSSLAALVALGAAPLMALGLGQIPVAGVAACLFALAVVRHYENIKRLRAGTESRIGEKRGAAAGDAAGDGA